ncbi:hypothetical protein KC363_g6393 [Hortaea werneckii]|uniref:PWWP domain-containing protein n=1 Tax=Hortaea werneckii TaxID=91943 RepID=A0A3M7F2T8_HORWE|nr:hypothetical protein KC361_g6798 [Hortaea werneckii]KAI6881556.1 hypothetical protein KC325_g6456 [Hortaea werneckii]KAI6989630.1 hypothetical protein KC359_g7130 [Hortaea werneckii]KAI7143229.1 hypothetical protein KC344_g6495 [Hortaea werneckii]KAI7170659.1 hypothetical protein KC360_g6642 [Hortaea werneckii]
MADEPTTHDTAPADAPAQPPSETAAEPTEPVTDNTNVTKEDEETAGKQATTEVNAPDGEQTTEVAEPPSAIGDATPASGKKDSKRKSTGAVPEHRMKKTPKKKTGPTLHLDCKPGEHYWARLKGYPPWPAIICDEEMLPESLLASRPISTARPDGSLRQDFEEGGKNAKDRTFPVMFLFTNEFSWLVNTGLTPLDPEQCKEKPKGKMTKALSSAYELAVENHDLQYYKDELKRFQEEHQQYLESVAEAEAEAERVAEEKAKAAEEAAKEEEKKPKKKARKSKGADEDVEMDDEEAPKSTKKRKKDADSEAENKPKKTPKVTKLNAPKTPNGESSAKKAAKPKKKVSAPKEEDEKEAQPQMTEAERLQQREKAVLYLRHRLQKGFLSRDQAPQEHEMASMADFFGQLENYDNLEPSIIRVTKIHKVLKAIVKLHSIPKDEEYNFKKRSAVMLEVWNKKMESDGDGAASAPPVTSEEPKSAPAGPSEEKEPATNGETKAAEPEAKPEQPDAEAKEGAEKDTEEKPEEKGAEAADKIEEKAVEKSGEETTQQAVDEPPAAPVEKTAPGNDARDEAVDGEGDVSMQTAPEMPAEAA